MGYYTTYAVEALSQSREAAEAAAKELAEMSGYSVAMTGDSAFEICEAKWYDWEKHTQMVSKNHPGVILHIWGSGEGSGDIWKAWAYAGEVFQSLAVMTFPEPPWLLKAVDEADAVITALRETEEAKIEKAEREELARLKEKYENG